jgi:membrane fusion protein, multidrug efflux system
MLFDRFAFSRCRRARVAFLTALLLPTAVFAQTALGVSRGTLRGVLMPLDIRQLSAPVAGVVEKFGAEEGQTVAAGALLVQLNSDVERADLERAEALLEASQIEFERTKRELDRTTALNKQGIGPQKDFDDANYSHDIARVKRRQATAEVALAKAKLDDRIITAPINGLVFRRTRAVGEAVERQEIVVRLIDASKLQLTVYGSAELLGKFRSDQPVRMMVETGAARGTQITGSVSYVDPIMDPESATFRIIIQVSPDDKVQSGISVTLQLPSEVN